MSSLCAEPPRLLLAIAALSANDGAAPQGRPTSAITRGAETSRLGRELLTRLAAQLGHRCALEGWSPRGAGPPRHTDLPCPWTACLSHSGGLVVAGLGEVPIGLDIEAPSPSRKRRHQRRLEGLIETLPEAEVRHAIRASSDPLAAFYRAWTLHEACYKLGCLADQPPDHVLATRIASLVAMSMPKPMPMSAGIDLKRDSRPFEQPLNVWQAQDQRLTLSLCSLSSQLVIEMPLGGRGIPFTRIRHSDAG
ncbi:MULTISPECIES: 4'-phosphopantetheinyl transferase family protein [unclassified Halomonas]|uniref:4'-phosphopantetheinyl transferase family protein n=1 Tax=unclassified Halomonas TaxID=2609666 RepID=UPI001C9580A8|nr:MULTISPECIES: 4'-phosphopantetheinyl transferase superfamily protein [unclassified Halomonas]MBY5926857.1 4'-phosphopantetheinyl transferase superfamily protein [Halomonas sp. DP4Y7-2]MBY6233899.1 4'-phosphopantetheinyl transferase superfamily protein [Halomonas sp. DP4Y7-1]